MTAPRTWPLAALDVGDRLLVAANGDDPRRVAVEAHDAARALAHRGYRARIARTRAFVIVKRLPDADAATRKAETERRCRNAAAAAGATIAELEAIGRLRALTDPESRRLERALRSAPANPVQPRRK